MTSCSHSFLHPSLSLTKIGLASLSVGLLQEKKKKGRKKCLLSSVGKRHGSQFLFTISISFHVKRGGSISKVLHHSYECTKRRERKIIQSEQKLIKRQNIYSLLIHLVQIRQYYFVGKHCFYSLSITEHSISKATGSSPPPLHLPCWQEYVVWSVGVSMATCCCWTLFSCSGVRSTLLTIHRSDSSFQTLRIIQHARVSYLSCNA